MICSMDDVESRSIVQQIYDLIIYKNLGDQEVLEKIKQDNKNINIKIEYIRWLRNFYMNKWKDRGV